MTWFAFALIAPMLWAIVNLIDDNMLRNVYRSANFGAVISGFFGFLPAIFLFLTNEHLITDPKFIVSAITAGLFTIVFYYFYFQTLNMEEPSVAIALFSLAPAIVPLLAWVFLDEQLLSSQYVGIAMILGAALMLSVIDIRKLTFSSALVFAIFGSLAYAVVSILSKYAYEGGSYAEIYAWIAVGFGLGGLAFLTFGKKQKEIKKIVFSAKKKILIILVIAEIINILAEMTQGYAIKGGPISVVRAIEGIQPIYVLLLGVLLSPFFPKLFREVVDERFPKKIILMLVMVVGLVFIHSGIKN